MDRISSARLLFVLGLAVIGLSTVADAHEGGLTSSSALTLAARGIRLQSNWDAVEALAPASRLVVSVAHRRTIRGQFFSADDRELVLTVPGNRLEHVARTDVLEVQMLLKRDFETVSRQAGPYALIGLGAGAAVALVSCAKRTEGCTQQGWVVGTFAFGAVGGMIGAGVGTLVALNHEPVVSVYHAPTG